MESKGDRANDAKKYEIYIIRTNTLEEGMMESKLKKIEIAIERWRKKKKQHREKKIQLDEKFLIEKSCKKIVINH